MEMFRRIISILTLIFIVAAFTGCATSKKRTYSEKKGLMLLDITQLGKNKGYYSKHRAKSINKDYKKYSKKKYHNKKKANRSGK
jgi:hypothetical protein